MAAMTLPLARIILFAVDLPALTAFYRDVLQLPLLPDPGEDGWTEFDAGGVALALHSGGKPKDARGATKLVFGTDNVEQTRALWVARGVTLADVQTFGELQFADGVDPEGNRLQISNRGVKAAASSQTVTDTPVRDITPVPDFTPIPAMSSVPAAPSAPVMAAPVAPEPVIPAPDFAIPPPVFEIENDATPPSIPSIMPPAPEIANIPEPNLQVDALNALINDPAVPVFTLQGYLGLAVIFRDFFNYLNANRTTAITQPELADALKELGGIGMMAKVGEQHRRIAVFPSAALPLAPTKTTQPAPLELASGDIYPLG